MNSKKYERELVRISLKQERVKKQAEELQKQEPNKYQRKIEKWRYFIECNELFNLQQQHKQMTLRKIIDDTGLAIEYFPTLDEAEKGREEYAKKDMKDHELIYDDAVRQYKIVEHDSETPSIATGATPVRL